MSQHQYMVNVSLLDAWFMVVYLGGNIIHYILDRLPPSIMQCNICIDFGVWSEWTVKTWIRTEKSYNENSIKE